MVKDSGRIGLLRREPQSAVDQVEGLVGLAKEQGAGIGGELPGGEVGLAAASVQAGKVGGALQCVIAVAPRSGGGRIVLNPTPTKRWATAP